MIYYVVGKPRSGKTYWAVNMINNLVKSKSDDFDQIYTNIGGFKYDQFENVKKLDYEWFFDTWVRDLHDYFKKAKREHDDYDHHIVEKVRQDGFYRSIFFCDEAQEYLSRDLAHIRWLFSYQGHLGFNFYFITQALGLIKPKYKYTIEYVVSPVASSFKLSNKYSKYNYYATTRMLRSDKYMSERLFFRKEIFDLYKSGDKIKHKSFLIPKLIMLAFLFGGLFAYYKFSMSAFAGDPVKVKSDNPDASKYQYSSAKKNDHAVPPARKVHKMSDAGDQLLRIRCYDSICSSKHFQDIPYPVLRKFFAADFTVVNSVQNMYSIDIYVTVSSRTLDMFVDFVAAKPTKDKKDMLSLH
ncbi:hypothetical protein YH65_11035 [Sulfurovum lithotrophicum]|uniref:Zona occludens toxin N-terminal domain-containing protein n=1 Tax=Sulfurovum lithotrophicum TaxID=206403 RepID=A0A7U4M2V5_9BACT|nr:zonular occludens toxin domain-containing protein [Sulfurovum lithotrophicum]AKF25855.1 hypothetical protein YH65_11035 [Sulfurovum lithotrophicum]